MVDKFILEAVKDASKEHKDIPNYDKLCEEHAEKVEAFIIEMLHTSRPAKQKEPEGTWMMTQDPELPKDVIEIIKDSQHGIIIEGKTGSGMSYELLTKYCGEVIDLKDRVIFKELKSLPKEK